MIVEFFSLFALCISLAGWGKWLEILFKIKTDLFSVLMIFGLITFSVTATFTALFFPLNLKIEAIFLIISLIPFFLQKKNILFPKNIPTSKWFWLFCLVLLLTGAYRPFLPDHFGYYIPTLNWLSDYGLIKGAANVDWTLGQMSFHHIVQAGFDNILDIFQRLNIFIAFIFLTYIFERKSFTLLLFLPLSFLFLQSPSPDLPAVLFSLMAAHEIIFVKENKRLKFNILLLISVFVFIIKPIAFWLPLWILLIQLVKHRKSAFCLKDYWISIFLLLLFTAKNLYCASVLFFPMTSTAVHTSWLPDFKILEQSSQIALLTTYHFHFTLHQIADFSLWERIYHWFLSCGFQSAVHCFMLLIVITFGFFSWKKQQFVFYGLLFSVVLKLIFVFRFSGQYRFMLDGILVLLFVLLGSLKINCKILKTTSLTLCLTASALLAFPVVLQKSAAGFSPAYMLKTADFKSVIFPQNYELKKFQTKKIGNLNFNISTQYRFNFDTPPPAVTLYNLKFYQSLGVFPQRRDSADVHQGFYTKNLSPEEKKQLDILVEKLNNESIK
ncbi:MAG: hypothetical protein LBT29_07805 [Flavobacteriaceae bacterium]|jgi:hypothetical protein|nr:hypothetical protein [Flavobacteriaceae bacterium]